MIWKRLIVLPTKSRTASQQEIQNEQPVARNDSYLQLTSPQQQTWDWLSYAGYWGIPNMTVWTWSTGGALGALGLSSGEIMAAITVGNIIICLYICLMSVPGTKYRIGYSLSQRLPFGPCGSFLAVIIRFILSLIFFGAQAWLGGISVGVALKGFSHRYFKMKNTLPGGAEMTTDNLIGFVIFLVIQAACLFSRPDRFDLPLILSCGVTFICFTAVLAVCLQKNHGIGSTFYERYELENSRTGWMWMYAMAIWYGAISPEITNLSDYSRYAKSSTHMVIGTCAAVMLVGTFVPLAALICASATSEIYGKAYWNPTDILCQWLEDRYSTSHRVAAIICGLVFALSQLTFNVVSNGFPGGMGLSLVFPNFINVTSGSLITAMLSWAVQPWRFFATSSTFLVTMSSFGIITTPIIAIASADYYVIRRGVINVHELLQQRLNFFAFESYNLLGIISLVITLALGLPGLIAENSKSSIPLGFMNYFYGSTLFAFVTPALLYLLLCYLFQFIRGPSKVDGLPSVEGSTVDESRLQKDRSRTSGCYLGEVYG